MKLHPEGTLVLPADIACLETYLVPYHTPVP